MADDPMADDTSPSTSPAPSSQLPVPAPADVLERLYRTHYPHLRDYGLKLVGPRSTVEDAIQDVFVSLWNGDVDPDAIDAPRRYLLTALRRRLLRQKATDQRRWERNRQYVEAAPSFALSHEDLLVTRDLRAEQRTRLEQALSSLSDRRREALYLRFYHGLRYAEVAAVMNVRNQTVRNYVSEALDHLRATVRPAPADRPENDPSEG